MVVPPWLEPLTDPAMRDQSLPIVVSRVIERLDFTTMLYGTARTAHRGGDERFYCWTTVPPAWIAEYDANSYVEIDPRIAFGWDSPPPLVWDETIAGGDKEVGRFLERASRHGIGSGLALYFSVDGYSVLVSLNKPIRRLSAAARDEIEAKIGDALHFAYVFHWMYMRKVVANGVAPMQYGHPLSAREAQCLAYAAHGMTSAVIALKLGITERTANFHFSNAISKLGVVNRQEAIALAVASGLIRVEPLGDANRSPYFARQAQSRRRSV